MRLDKARADMAAEIEKIWPRDVGAELDTVSQLRATVEYEGQRAPTAMSCTFALLNKWHRDTGDERVTDELASTTVVTLDLATVGDLEAPPEPRRRGKRQERGRAPYEEQFHAFLRKAWNAHLGTHVLAYPPPPAGTVGGPMWNFVVGRAVRLNLGGTGVGAAVRFRAAETWHSTVHDAPASRARCLCGMGFYNKSSIVGPLRYRFDKLMRDVIRAGGLPVDDLAAYGSNAYEFDTVEDRYLEALHALDRDPGTHPRDALARLAQGGAAPAAPVEPPERVYDDGEDAIDDMGIDGFIE